MHGATSGVNFVLLFFYPAVFPRFLLYHQSKRPLLLSNHGGRVLDALFILPNLHLVFSPVPGSGFCLFFFFFFSFVSTANLSVVWLLQFGSESQQLEWATRESEREEHDRLRRLRLQEQQDLELAIALSRADAPGS